MESRFRDSSSSDVLAITSTSSQPISDQESGYIVASNAENAPRKTVDWILVRMVMAEALGTFMLVFCIGGIIGNMQFMKIERGLMEYAATAGLTVIVIVFSMGSISGAHINPSVPLYVAAQVGGSVLATYAGKFVYGIKAEVMMTRPIQGSTSAFWVELIATFIILFLTTSLFTQKQHHVMRPVSGGSMNPARSLGPALVSWRFDHLWIYMAAPTIGAILGVFVYRVLRLQGWSCQSASSIQLNHISLQ
ncbi:aquaporin NIP1.1 [Striga asiatica]|uniref:Aquaporin NIP1.1 n=1 Tax=Striga asiatica TaxID=4170 RepID=A0A5A7QHZ8_STRAF|nr:aquaporin NIP1.1 [Striga asiatica]